MGEVVAIVAFCTFAEAQIIFLRWGWSGDPIGWWDMRIIILLYLSLLRCPRKEAATLRGASGGCSSGLKETRCEVSFAKYHRSILPQWS